MKLISSILIVSLSLVLFTIAGCGSRDNVSHKANISQKRYEFGRRAYNAGVPAEANPYQGRDYSYASQWLEGWMKAKEEDKSQKSVME